MKSRLLLIPGLCASTLLAPSSTAGVADLVPTDLRCEYAADPLGVDAPKPRLFWKLKSNTRGQKQSAYRVIAASSPDSLNRQTPDLWDSGKVKSDETVHIRYQGVTLKSSQQVFWKLRVWDRTGKASAWSEPATFTMGILEEADWHAKWLSAQGAGAKAESSTNYQTLLLRREFPVRAGLRRAVVHLCGLGQHELSVNGNKVGANLISPGWTKYDKTCLYDTFDITHHLGAGANALGVSLGNGMYNVRGGRYTKFTGSFGPLKAICQVRLEYGDGSVSFVGSDEQWQVAPGPITFSCIYGGEDYDARLEPKGWDKAGSNESSLWRPALVVNGPGGKLKGLSCAAPPLRAFDVLKPVATKTLRPGVTVYDLGQNASLMPRLAVKGTSGSRVRIIPAELVQPDGSADRGSCGGGNAWWQYTLAGDGVERWFPQFFYHGCRYLQVECSAPEGEPLPEIRELVGVVVHSSSQAVGEFECSNPLFNRVRTLVRWAQRSNMASLMTDCPHREKLGWLEEDHLNGPSLRYEYDLAQLFTKAMNDMADSQRENGLVPDIAPEYVRFEGGFVDSPEWGSAYLLVPWQQYQFTGDIELLRRNYDGMKRYVAYLGSRSTNHIVSHGLGDWYDIGPKPPGYAQLTPIPLTATAFYYLDAGLLSRAAALLGKPVESKEFADLASSVRRAFNAKFYNSEKGCYASGSQCANAVALVMNLAEPRNRQAVLESIVQDVRTHGNALTAGDVGYRYLLRALAEGGRSDVIFDINNQSEKPGYGYQLKQGATSLTEAWDAGKASSQNHFMLGQIMEWFYHDLAGIQCDPAGPGFKRIVLKPSPVGDLAWVKAGYNSLRGRIVSEWRKSSQRFELNVTIPPATTATVYLPTTGATHVLESGLPVKRARQVKFVRQSGPYAVFEVASGSYAFSVPARGH